MEYPLNLYTPRRAGRPTHATQAAQRLDMVIDAATTAGIELPGGFTEARAALDRTRDLARDYNAAREDRDNPARIADDLAAGTIDFDIAAQRAMRATVAEPGGVLSRAAEATGPAATRQAFAAAGAALNAEGILDECRAVVANVIDEVRSLRKNLDGITNDSQAARGGSKQAAAWSNYLRAIDRWDAAFNLAHLLRFEGWLPALPSPMAPKVVPVLKPNLRRGRRYEKPHEIDERLELERRMTRRGGKVDRPFLHLLDPISDTGEPGGPWTVAEETAYWEAADEMLRAKARQVEATKRGFRRPPSGPPRSRKPAHPGYIDPPAEPTDTRTLPDGTIVETYEAA